MIIRMSLRPIRRRKPKDISEDFVDGTFSESEYPKLYPIPKTPKNLIANSKNNAISSQKKVTKTAVLSKKPRLSKATNLKQQFATTGIFLSLSFSLFVIDIRMTFGTGYDDRDENALEQDCPLFTEHSSELCRLDNIQQTIEQYPEHQHTCSPDDYGNHSPHYDKSPERGGDCSPEDYEHQQSRKRRSSSLRDEYGSQRTTVSSPANDRRSSLDKICSSNSNVVPTKAGIDTFLLILCITHSL